MRPIAKKQQRQNVDHVTGDKIPRSFVFSRCKLPGSLRQLQSDLRKLMLPFTALNLKVVFFFCILGWFVCNLGLLLTWNHGIRNYELL